MKNFIKSIRITIAFCILFSVCYVLILWVFGQFFGPGKGNAETVTLNGKVVGAANVGQTFTKDIYFWGRPSCAGDGLRQPIIMEMPLQVPTKVLRMKNIWQKSKHA